MGRPLTKNLHRRGREIADNVGKDFDGLLSGVSGRLMMPDLGLLVCLALEFRAEVAGVENAELAKVGRKRLPSPRSYNSRPEARNVCLIKDFIRKVSAQESLTDQRWQCFEVKQRQEINCLELTVKRGRAADGCAQR